MHALGPRQRTAFAALAALVLLLVSATPAWAAAPGPQEIADFFSDSRGAWYANLHRVASYLVATLFALEVYFSWADWQLRGVGVQTMIAELVPKLFLVSVAVWLFWNPNLLLDPLVRGFRRIGETTVGTTYAPDQVFDQGVLISEQIRTAIVASVPEVMGTVHGHEWDVPTTMLGLSELWLDHLGVSWIVSTLAILVIPICYGLAALQMWLGEIELQLALGVGVFFSGFATFRLTAGLTDGYLRYLVELGVRLFLLQFMIGSGMHLASSSVAAMREPLEAVPFHGDTLHIVDFTVPLRIAFAAVLYAYLTWKVPSGFAQRIARDLDPGLRRTLGRRAS